MTHARQSRARARTVAGATHFSATRRATWPPRGFLVQGAAFYDCRDPFVTSDPRRTDLVLRAFNELTAGAPGCHGIRPGDLNDLLRKQGAPLGGWEIRFELSQLEHAGKVVVDPATGRFHPANGAADKRRNRA
jgi:hypothetical protein